MCASIVGCQPSQTTVEETKPGQVQLTGPEIFAEIIRQYKTADSYSDQAMLYLNYRIDGRLIQEPQPWAICWSRDDGLSARLFNAQIQFDGQRMSCFVFDIDTANLDGQQWVARSSEAAEIDRLLKDPIGQHFMCGYSELPLDEAEKSLPTFIVPPTLYLCGGSQSSGWLHQPSTIQRLPDHTLDGIPCYVLQLPSSSGQYELYVNQQSGLIEQLNLPIRFLDPRVRTAEEIEDIKLFARFHDAQLNATVDPTSFRVERRDQAKVVGQFVSIPEPFPSDWIGKELPTLPLRNPDGSTWANSELAGQTTALCWFANDVGALEQFVQLSESASQSDQTFYAVYSDTDLSRPGDENSGLSEDLQRILPETSPGAQWLYDPQLTATQQLDLSTIPMIVVVGPKGKLQYVQGLTEADWPNQVNAAMRRIEQGEDVASEMRREYQNYRRQYDEQLAANDQTALFAEIQDPTTTPDAEPSAILFSKKEISDPLTSGGNFASGEEHLYVLDGFQTIAAVGVPGGKVTRKIGLELPETQGINRLRALTTENGKNWFAGFSMLGRTAFLFDDNWETIFQYPPATTSHGGISDVQLIDVGADRPHLRVGFVGQQGIHQVDTTTGETMVLCQEPTRSMSAEPVSLYVSGDELRRLRDGSTVDETYQYRAVVGDARIQLALGKNLSNQWHLVAFSPAGEKLWDRPLGNQAFETDLENVSLSAHQNWLAIADIDNRVELIDFSGVRLGEHTFDQPIHGLTVCNTSTGNQLAVSFADHVELWQLDAAPVRSVSGEWSAPNK